MEGINHVEMNSSDKEAYAVFKVKNPGMSEADFMELRSLALAGKSSNVHNFFVASGVLIEGVDAEEARDQGNELK